MVGVTGGYSLYRNASTEWLSIDAVDADGNLRDSSLGGNQYPITGTYDEATSALTFRAGGIDGRGEGNLFVSHYTGYPILDGDGNITVLAGTYTEFVIKLNPFGYVSELGGWYAIPGME
ncbi:MAG: hypothetical protein WAK83_20100 [Trebonia sp.]|uniref:hypothetical protein n=1 Tax=Trebonia sp. TaxID=2767075 RepID=UPI003BB0B915